jgi:hypothetical protein
MLPGILGLIERLQMKRNLPWWRFEQRTDSTEYSLLDLKTG